MIAVIAGKGSLPEEACRQLVLQQKNFFVIALFEESASRLGNLLPQGVPIITQTHYKLGQIKAALLAEKATQVLFIGKVDKKDIFNHLKLDWYAIKLLASTINKSDASLMERCIAELQRHNISVVSQAEVLQHLHVQPGLLTGNYSVKIEQEVRLGMEIAQTISAQGIGQTVIMKDGVVIAVEAVEGTDACIKRGIQLGKEQLIICKTANKNHNKKYDIPTLGSASLEGIKKGQVAAVSWQAEQTFIADLDKFIARAQELDITLVAL